METQHLPLTELQQWCILKNNKKLYNLIFHSLITSVGNPLTELQLN